MKTLLFSCIILISFPTKAEQPQQQEKINFSIEGTLKNFTKKKAVLKVSWQEPWEFREYAKVDIVNGKFKVTGEISQPTVAVLRIVTYNDSMKAEQNAPWECDAIEFFLCKGKTTLLGEDSLATASIQTQGGDYSIYKEFIKSEFPIVRKIDSITALWKKALAQKDSITVKYLDKVYLLALEEKNKNSLSFVFEHPSSYVSIFLLNRFVYQVTDKPGNKIALGILQTLPQHLRSSPIGVAIEERIDQKLFPLVGTPMHAISLKDKNDKKTNLLQYKGKVVLIDFWASWCFPCRKENPELRKLYDAYKDKGLEIIGISQDQKKEQWQMAIKQDELSWPQFVDEELDKGGKASRLFRVSSLPANFLVNQEGVIVGQRMSIVQLEAKIKALLSIPK